MEVHPFLRPRRAERQQGVERRAAALLAAAEHQPAGCGPRNRLRRLAGQKLVDDGSILFAARSERSQEQNRRAALERLAELIRAALIEPKIRKKTRPTRASQERRIESKKRRAGTKQSRASRSWD